MCTRPVSAALTGWLAPWWPYGRRDVVDDGHEQAGAVAPPAGPQLGRQRLEPLFLFRPRGLGDQVLLRKRRHAFRSGHELVEPCLCRGGGLMDQDRPLRSIDSDMPR